MGRRFAAATTAERTPKGSDAYWHVKVVSHGGKYEWQLEEWTKPDGRTWFRGTKTNGKTLDGK